MVPVVSPTVSVGSGQIYGAHAFRRRYDIIRGADSTFKVLYRRIEMVQFTKSTDTYQLQSLSGVTLNVEFLPVRTDISIATGDCIVLSPAVAYTDAPALSVFNWLITGFFLVGGPYPSNRLVLVTERQ